MEIVTNNTSKNNFNIADFYIDGKYIYAKKPCDSHVLICNFFKLSVWILCTINHNFNLQFLRHFRIGLMQQKQAETL